MLEARPFLENESLRDTVGQVPLIAQLFCTKPSGPHPEQLSADQPGFDFASDLIQDAGARCPICTRICTRICTGPSSSL